MQTLERRLELGGVVAISISAMLGSGIFVLPGLAAVKTGPSVWLAYLVAGFCVLPAALSKAELGTAMPTAGGTYVYLERTFGPLAGTIAGLGLWLSLLLKGCFALIGLGVYLVVVVDVPVKPVALGVLAVAIALNVSGVHGVSRVQKIITSTAIGVLAILVLGGLFKVDPEQLRDEFPHGGSGFVSAVALVVISFAGVTKIAAIAEEVRRPGRNLPAGILLSLAIVMLLYSTVAFVLAGDLPPEKFAGDLRPIHSLALLLGGSGVGKAIAVIGVLTMGSMATAGLLAASRFPFAMSRDELLPSFFSGVHPRFLTPVGSILVSGLFMAIAILLFDIERIAKLASAFMIMMFAANCLTVIVLRELGVQWYKPSFRSPLYPWIQLFGVISGIVLLISMGPLAGLAVVAIAAPGLVLYVLHSRGKIHRSGVVFKRSRRASLLKTIPPVDPSGHLTQIVEERAAVVVALFGNEPSPEVLVELAEGLADGRHVEVVYLDEVPEQLMLDAVPENPHLASVQRRIEAMAEARGMDIDFLAVATHDVVETVSELSSRIHCDWLVIEWRGRTRGTFTISNPLGWLKDHLDANLARFHDAGVRYIRKILVYVEPGRHDMLVAGTADRLAQLHHAELTFASFATHEAAEIVVEEKTKYLEQFQQLCESPSQVVVVRGQKEAVAIGNVTAAFDLLVTAEAPERTLLSRVVGTGSDRLTATAAACSVLRVQSPRRRTHDALQRSYSGVEREPNVLSLINPECVGVKLPPMKKDALFLHFAERFAAVHSGLDAQILLNGLWERERSQNTSVGDGVAMPHATSNVSFTELGIFTMAEPMDFGAPDGQGVDVFFVTIGDPRDRSTHLVLLSALSKMIMETKILEGLRAARTREEILRTVRDCIDERTSQRESA